MEIHEVTAVMSGKDSYRWKCDRCCACGEYSRTRSTVIHLRGQLDAWHMIVSPLHIGYVIPEDERAILPPLHDFWPMGNDEIPVAFRLWAANSDGMRRFERENEGD